MQTLIESMLDRFASCRGLYALQAGEPGPSSLLEGGTQGDSLRPGVVSACRVPNTLVGLGS